MTDSPTPPSASPIASSSIDWTRTALFLVDPQVDLLSPKGGAWDLFGEQVRKRHVVDNLVALRAAADNAGVPVIYSRVELTSEDYDAWQPHNPLQQMFGERRLMTAGEGANFLDELAPRENNVVLAPRKGPTPDRSAVSSELRGRGIDAIVVAGMVANLCVESQVRAATDEGFDAIVVGDAIATMSDDAHDATLANFGLLATAVMATDDVVRSLAGARSAAT